MYKTMLRAAPAVALALLCAVPAHADRIDDLMHAQMRDAHIPGAAVAVLRDGKLDLRTYGLANVEQGAPVSVHTRFQIASVTKTLTGILLGHLIDQGKLSLDEKLTHYLPDAPAAWSAITLRQLGDHTAGFAMGDPGSTTETMDEAVGAIMRRPLAARPGEREQYALDDFIILAKIMERVTGKTYFELLDEVIVKPLGLTDTGFENAVARGSRITADVLPNRVSIYRWERGQQRLFWFLYPPASYAAGGLFTSIHDLAAILQALDGGKLVGERGRKAIWTPSRLNDGQTGSFGIGWIIGTTRGLPSVGHNGGPALGDVLYVPGKHLGVIVLINQHSFYPNLAQTIAGYYLPASPLIGAAGIADADPALSKRLFGIVRAFRDGQADAAQFGAGMRKDLDEYKAWTARRMAVLPPPERMVLLSETQASGQRARVYRVVYGRLDTQRWRFDLDASGLVTGFDIGEE